MAGKRTFGVVFGIVYVCVPGTLIVRSDPISSGQMPRAPLVRKNATEQEEVMAISWDSARIRALVRPLETPGYDQWVPVNRAWPTERALVKILKQELSKNELHELAASFATMQVGPPAQSSHASLLLVATLDIFLDSGDREGLVTLLSSRCPRSIGIRCGVEFYVVYVAGQLGCGKEKPKDLITVFGDAYSRCHVADVRNEIAAAVRRAFCGVGVHGNDDAEFVKNAMQWYGDNKDQLVVNPRYAENYDISSGGGNDENPLFKRKPLDKVDR